MSDSPYIIEITPENFHAVIVEGSASVPVLVDFWADWCQPCQTLMPILANLAEQYQGRFILAKVNTEEHQELAGQLGIRSLPTVKLFIDGQPVDEFMGALPESDVRAFLDKHIPAVHNSAIDIAQKHMMQGDADTALSILNDAKQATPDDINLDIALAQALTANKQTTEAAAILEALPADAKEMEAVKVLQNHLHFDALSSEGDSSEILLQRLADNPNDSEAMLQLAGNYMADQEPEKALELLLTLMKTDREYQDGAAQKNMIMIFELLGNHPLVKQYRNKMLNLIY